MTDEEARGGADDPVTSLAQGTVIARHQVTSRSFTEHRLQALLTQEWATNGVAIAGERFFLTAWEVMDNYRINSAQRGFGRPAIDFLLLDSQGRMVAVELKLSVRSPRDCWSVLCQVTALSGLRRSSPQSCWSLPTVPANRARTAAWRASGGVK